MDDLHDMKQKLQALVQEAGGRLVRTPAASAAWLRMNSGLGEDLIELMCAAWPSETLQLGPYCLDTLADMSDSERSEAAYRGGFFCIGSSGNGDLLVINRGSGGIVDCEVGLISHEVFWDHESRLSEIYEPICKGLTSLLTRSRNDEDLPYDYFHAKERREALRDDKKSVRSKIAPTMPSSVPLTRGTPPAEQEPRRGSRSAHG